MTLPVNIAAKLLQMMQGERLPASSLRHLTITKMVDDGIIQKLQSGKSKAILFVNSPDHLRAYLRNHFTINDLETYVTKFNEDTLTRSEAVQISGNSKLKSIGTFKGFLVNAYSPIQATLNSESFQLLPQPGTCTFIQQYETFIPHAAVTIVGIENPENFFNISRQQHLFSQLQPLFVCRYPQGGHIVKWLLSIPNPYLHFGDLDFEGINIYLNEYKKHLQEKATFFVPANAGEMLQLHGNRSLYDTQLFRAPAMQNIKEQPVIELMHLLHKYKKGLEQEVFIG